MKKYINRNFLWSKFFVERLEKLGVKHVCISPGSRSTPLTTAFSKSERIKKFVIVDERSSAFFALGLAKITGEPTVIVTTSGTATANLYPAIIEAYQSRIPLLICTADRPEYLRGTGANQTINQENIYANHIRFFKDTGLPALNARKFDELKKITDTAFTICKRDDRGPVHLNFPFEKPLEESIAEDVAGKKFLDRIANIRSSIIPEFRSTNLSDRSFDKICAKINDTERGIIYLGWDNYSKGFIKAVKTLSGKCKYPVLVDGASGYFFGNKDFLNNHTAFLRSSNFLKKYSPEIIIQFGNAPTSNPMLKFFEQSNALKISVNEYGDQRDPSGTFDKIIKADPEIFCKRLTENIKRNSTEFSDAYKKADEITERIKSEKLKECRRDIESAVIIDALKSLPTNSNLFISNSLPIRDVDFFKSYTSTNNVALFVNRGASGIDGITSTAAGIAAASGKPTLLITGDIAFFHDTNGLHTLKKYSLPLTVLLINNGGGAIFGMLPVADEIDLFTENFLTPLELDFSGIVNSFGGYYTLLPDKKQINKKLVSSFNRKKFSVLEVKTNYKESIQFRKSYFREVASELDKIYEK